MSSSVGFWMDTSILLQDSYNKECLFFNPNTGLNFFIKMSIDNLFSQKKRFFFENNYFMLNTSILCHLDGKYRSATSPLVLWSPQKRSLYTPRNNNETFSSQLCIRRYCRPQNAYLVPDREMLHWYIIDSGLTAFNQSLVDLDLNGLLVIIPVRGRVRFSDNKPLETGCFFCSISSVFDIDFFYNWWCRLSLFLEQNLNKIHLPHNFSGLISNARVFFLSYIYF